MPVATWQEKAACQGMEGMFFDDVGTVQGPPTPRAKKDRWMAKRVCAKCPVVQQCAEHARNTGAEFGVFGGLDQKERAMLRGARGDVRRLVTIALRLEDDGFSREEVAGLFDVSLATLNHWYSKSPRDPSDRQVIREYRAWPLVFQGAPAHEVSRVYSLPMDLAYAMCKAVDSDRRYRGPKERQRAAAWLARRRGTLDAGQEATA